MGAGHSHPLYLPGESPVHRLPAEVKIVAAFGVVLCVVATPREAFWVFGCYLLLLAAVWVAARIPPGWIARRALIEAPFVVLDAAMNDLVRPSLYDAWHGIEAVRPARDRMTADIVGPVCETGDTFAVSRETDLVEAGAPGGWDLILCGDVCYEAPMTNHIMPWFRRCRAQGAAVWIADPGRAYLPHLELTAFGPAYDVPTTTELEDREHRRTVLYALRA